MTVSLDWLAYINVVINTTILQVPSFNNCLMVGLFPSDDIPDTWGSSIYKTYTSYTGINTDFSALIIGTDLQANRYRWLLNAASEFFSQQPVPASLTIAQMPPATTDYIAAMATITAAFNNFYAFYIADQFTATTMNASTGIYKMVTSLATANSYKILFVDTSDLVITAGNFLHDSTIGGNPIQRVLLCAHTNNFTPLAGGSQAPTSLAGAAMGAFFTNLFSNGIGLKALSSQQLQSTLVDTVITAASLGIPGTPPPNGLLGVNGNVYAAFGSSPIGLMQYGFMASSTSSALLYLDQVIAKDYLQLNVQADLATYIINQQPLGGIPYSDVGIQLVVQVFKKTLQNAVNLNVIQPFSNSDIIAVNYANTPTIDVTNRIYQGLTANLRFLSRIQRVSVGVNLTL